MKKLCILSAFFALAGCSFFGGDEVDLSAPAELLEFDATLVIEETWRKKAGDGSGEVYPAAIPVLQENVIYVGDIGGEVSAIEKSNGNSLWVVDTGEAITGSVGVGGDLVVFGTESGEVHALAKSSGEFLWKAQLSSQVLASPATNGETVVAVAQDGKIYGLSAEDGSQIWLADVNLPLLTVHGNAKPTIVNDVAYFGLDNGKAVAYRLVDGIKLWEARVGVPEGKNDLERMVDVDGQLLYHNGNIYAASYQSGVMAINSQAGRGLWFQEGSVKNSPGAWGGTLVVTQEDGVVKAFNSSDGTLLWETDEFKNRQLNTPVLSSNYVAFADFEGYIHFLARRTGRLIGRTELSTKGVRSPMIIDGDNIYVLANSGTLSSLKVTAL